MALAQEVSRMEAYLRAAKVCEDRIFLGKPTGVAESVMLPAKLRGSVFGSFALQRRGRWDV